MQLGVETQHLNWVSPLLNGGEWLFPLNCKQCFSQCSSEGCWPPLPQRHTCWHLISLLSIRTSRCFSAELFSRRSTPACVGIWDNSFLWDTLVVNSLVFSSPQSTDLGSTSSATIWGCYNHVQISNDTRVVVGQCLSLDPGVRVTVQTWHLMGYG